MSAFMPSAGIEDPHRFSGRRDQVRDLTNSLYASGSIPMILGQRGLGKSSLALQLSRIAQGDVELLAQHELESLALPEDSRFLTIFVSCSDATKNFAGLVQEMINAALAHKFERDRSSQDAYHVVDRTSKRKLSLKLFTAESITRFEARASELDTRKFSPAERLVHIAQALTDVSGQPVLFIIDEVDRIAPIKGLASFLKSHSSATLKFALVGIGSTQSDLIADHASVHRQLEPVVVKTMSVEELVGIVTRTEEYLHENDEPFEFTPDASERLALISGGFPWFVHVIGQTALLEAEEFGSRDITVRTITDAVKSLATNRYARMYDDLYHLAVRDSSHREYVLRLLAAWGDEKIPTSAIYPKANRLGVSGPSTYLGHLTRAESGKVIVRSEQQARALYRFADEMFKVYVRLRPSLYEGVKEEVDRIMR